MNDKENDRYLRISMVIAFIISILINSYIFFFKQSFDIKNLIIMPIPVIIHTIFIGSFINYLICLAAKIKTNFSKIKNIPKENYHILGYITFCYIIAILIMDWYYGKIDYGFYEILRWLVASFSVWSSTRIYQKNPKSRWLLVFIIIAILFNPILKIKLEQETWQIVDFGVLLVFFVYSIHEDILTKLLKIFQNRK